MPPMNKEQLNQFLKRPLIAKIATLLRDGSPTITPIWFEWNERSRTFLLWARKGYGGVNAGWYDNLRGKQQVALLVDESSELNPKHDRVLAIGKAKILRIPKNWLDIQLRMTRRYVGRIKTQEYLATMPNAPGGWVTVVPNRVISWTEAENINMWHERYLQAGGKPVYR